MSRQVCGSSSERFCDFLLSRLSIALAGNMPAGRERPRIHVGDTLPKTNANYAIHGYGSYLRGCLKPRQRFCRQCFEWCADSAPYPSGSFYLRVRHWDTEGTFYKRTCVQPVLPAC